MQKHPDKWDTLLAGSHYVEYKVLINGVEYPAQFRQGTPTIEKPMMEEPVIGRCCTGTYNVVIRKREGIEIPKAAQVKVSARLVSPDRTVVTDYVPQGEYWIIKRSGLGDLLTLTCRDNMIFAGQTWADRTSFYEWPVSMVDAFNEICALMNVEIDPRTVIYTGDMYKVDAPSDDTLMSEVLGAIAAAHGGNFIMTESGKIRLVPFPKTGEPVYDAGGGYRGYTPYSTGENTISRVTLSDDADNQFSAGDDTGIELLGSCYYVTQEMVDAVAEGYYIHNGTFYSPFGEIINGTATIEAESISLDAETGTVKTDSIGVVGRSFLPYEVSGAFLDPCIELGDTITIIYKGETLRLIVNSMLVNCTVGYSCDISNGVQDEDEEEVPYRTAAEIQQERVIYSNKVYHGNRINRKEGFVSELMENDVAVARMIANSNLFAMQRNINGAWEDVLYFDPVARQYKFSGEVEIDTGDLVLSAISLDTSNLIYVANSDGEIILDNTSTVNVIAYTGKKKVTPTGISVSGLPEGMSYTIGSPDSDSRVPITFTVKAGVTFGGKTSLDGEITITVTGPIEERLKLSWAKVNTGAAGDTGNSYAQIRLYKRGSTTPAKPNGNAVYTFDTNTITGALNGWTLDIPAGTNPCYTISATAFTNTNTVTIPASSWTNQVLFVENGEDATNSAFVQLYRRSKTALTADDKPTEDVTYNFSRGTVSGVTNSWQAKIPNGSDPCYTISAVVTSQDATGVIAVADWTDPVILVQNGDNGDPGASSGTVTLYLRSALTPATPTGDIIYTFLTGGCSGDLAAIAEGYYLNNGTAFSPIGEIVNGTAIITDESIALDTETGTVNTKSIGVWSQTIPASNGNPCYVTQTQVGGTTSTVTITGDKWSTPVILMEDGKEGSVTYYQDAMPTTAKPGDLWIASAVPAVKVDGYDDMEFGENELFRMNDNGIWESMEELSIPEIRTSLASAQATLQAHTDAIEARVTTTQLTESNRVILEQYTSAIQHASDALKVTFSGQVKSLDDRISGVDAKYETYIRASGNGVEIGKSSSDMVCQITNKKLSFVQKSSSGDTEVAYISNKKLYITSAQITKELLIGTGDGSLFKWSRTSKGLALRYVS